MSTCGTSRGARRRADAKIDNTANDTKHVHVNRRVLTKESLKAASSRARHRARLLTALLEICRKLEQMQDSAEARLACREVSGHVLALLNRENAAMAQEEE